MRTLHSAVAALAAVAGSLYALSAPAAQIPFPEPTGWAVGDPGTTFQAWSAGTTAPNSSILAPDALVAESNPPLATQASFSQSGAFLSGSGGLYQFMNNYSVTASVPNHGGPGLGTWILVQSAATMNPDYDPEGDGTGGSLLQDAIKVFDNQGNLLAASNPDDVIRTFLDPDFPLFGGVQFEKLAWSVFVPGYTGDFVVTADMIIHSSLQALRIDSSIAAVPEPSSSLLLALGLTGLAACRLRRNRRGQA